MKIAVRFKDQLTIIDGTMFDLVSYAQAELKQHFNSLTIEISSEGAIRFSPNRFKQFRQPRIRYRNPACSMHFESGINFGQFLDMVRSAIAASFQELKVTPLEHGLLVTK